MYYDRQRGAHKEHVTWPISSIFNEFTILVKNYNLTKRNTEYPVLNKYQMKSLNSIDIKQTLSIFLTQDTQLGNSEIHYAHTKPTLHPQTLLTRYIFQQSFTEFVP